MIKTTPFEMVFIIRVLMIDIEVYMGSLIDLLKNRFSSRLLFVGMQGSYLRGEATQNSDIDVMVILDTLTMSDLNDYRSIVQSLPHTDKSCGFICSRKDLANWNPLEICHVLNSTKDYWGNLKEYIPAYTKQDIQNFIKLSVNNLYHEICHRYIHGDHSKNIAKLPFTYKSVFFILQNIFYLTHSTFIKTKAELLQCLTGKDHAVLERSLAMDRGEAFDFAESFELLFTWCQEKIKLN